MSERAVRAMVGGGAALVAVGAIALGVVVARLGPSPATLANRERAASGEHLLALEARLGSIGDSLAAVEKREQRIWTLAGLSSPTTVDSARAGRVPSTDSGALKNAMMATDIEHLITRANSLSASSAVVFDSLTRSIDRISRIPSIMPTAGWLSSVFSKSRFHPILHTSRPHEGIDVGAPMGAPIVAPAAGTVRYVGEERGYGLVLEIDHGNGLVTKYAHCSRIMVKSGQRVGRGQTIAAVGNSGLATGPHLHYEIHLNGQVVDPLTYVLPGAAIPD
ncbi:MAG: M23 family metallopeptidase [Gemmatimonadaceae bacterium]